MGLLGGTPVTGFFEVSCGAGYRCVSDASVLGVDHVGDFSGSGKRGSLQEAGCPARGVTNEQGHCVDGGDEEVYPRGAGVHYCWAQDRYEAGPDAPCEKGGGHHCHCVRTASSSTREEQAGGAEQQAGTYGVEPEQACRRCSELDSDRDRCNACANCEYGDRILKDEHHPLHVTGCFERDSGAAPPPPMPAKATEMRVQFHRPIWEPPAKANAQAALAARQRARFLPRDAWVSAYMQSAPRIQRVLDAEAARMKSQGLLADGWKLRCDGADGGANVAGVLERFEALQRECSATRTAAETLGAGSFPRGGQDLNCVPGDHGSCRVLNCYRDDEELTSALRHLRDRGEQCEAALRLLKQEASANGVHESEAWQETAAEGGALQLDAPEQPRPSPKPAQKPPLPTLEALEQRLAKLQELSGHKASAPRPSGPALAPSQSCAAAALPWLFGRPTAAPRRKCTFSEFLSSAVP